MPADPKSRRCASCDISWPTALRFKDCPRCEQPTETCTSTTPDDSIIAANLKHERWTAWHERERAERKAFADAIAELEAQFSA